MSNILEVCGLHKHYDRFELRDVSIALPYGTIMGFIGENGAGKSTTIKLILDVVHRDGGTVRLFGTDISDPKTFAALRQRIGIVYDDCCFPEQLQLGSLSTIMRRIYSAWDCNAFDNWLSRFSLDRAQTIAQLSRGMKMKLSLAVALSHNAELLILDEPTGGLDPVVRDELLDIFLEFVQDETHSVFVSSHITTDLEKIADYITFIHNGEILLSDEKDLMLERFGILKCDNDTLCALEPSAIRGVRSNQFGAAALVERSAVPKGFELEAATLEDIMLYTIKNEGSI